MCYTECYEKILFDTRFLALLDLTFNLVYNKGLYGFSM